MAILYHVYALAYTYTGYITSKVDFNSFKGFEGILVQVSHICFCVDLGISQFVA